jgi:hypothetical protein
VPLASDPGPEACRHRVPIAARSPAHPVFWCPLPQQPRYTSIPGAPRCPVPLATQSSVHPCWFSPIPTPDTVDFRCPLLPGAPSHNSRLHGKQREFPAPPWAGVKRVRSAAQSISSSSCRTIFTVREPRYPPRKTPQGCAGLQVCRAVVKPPTSTDTPPTAATGDPCCGGIRGVFGCYCSHTTHLGSAEGIKFACRRYAPCWERPNGEAPRHRARGTSRPVPLVAGCPLSQQARRTPMSGAPRCPVPLAARLSPNLPVFSR